MNRVIKSSFIYLVYNVVLIYKWNEINQSINQLFVCLFLSMTLYEINKFYQPYVHLLIGQRHVHLLLEAL